jgi:hypothetical protein
MGKPVPSLLMLLLCEVGSHSTVQPGGKMDGKVTPATMLSGTIIRGNLKSPNSQLVTPISIKLQRPDGCD